MAVGRPGSRFHEFATSTFDSRSHWMTNAARRLAHLVAAALVTSSCAATTGEATSPSFGSTASAQSGVQASPTPSASASAAATEPALHPLFVRSSIQVATAG